MCKNYNIPCANIGEGLHWTADTRGLPTEKSFAICRNVCCLLMEKYVLIREIVEDLFISRTKYCFEDNI